MFQPPPECFEGRLSAFVDAFVLPNLPAPDALCAWTDALLSYLSRTDAVCLVRGSRPSTDRVVYGDNAAARWIFLRARDGATSPDTLADRLARGDLPVRFATHTGPLAYGHTFDPADQRATAEPGLKHCHLASALEGAPDDPRVRAARNLAPLNHFLFPMAERFEMTRVGWVEACARPFDLGESPTVLATVAHRLRDLVGAAPLLRRLDAAMAWTLPPLPDDPVIAVVRRPAERPPGPLHAASRWWPALLAQRDEGGRLALLASVPHADARLARLVDDLTVTRLVQLAFALGMACDPRRLNATTPHPGEAAWALLEASAAPLGGRWARAVEALTAGGEPGLDALRGRDLAGFVAGLRGVEACVVRRLT